MKLKVVTPEHVVVEETVDAVYAETVDGEVGILPRHVPLVTPLKIGSLRFEQDHKKQSVAIMGGLLHTDGNDVSVLSNAAELAASIDQLRARQAEERAEALLKQKNDHVDIERANMALARARTRLKLSKAVSQDATR